MKTIKILILTGILCFTVVSLQAQLKVVDNKVGIGLSSPSYKLDVVAPANTWKGRFAGSDGWILIGPANSGWAHIYTDRSKFIFNKDVYSITGGFSAYSSGNLYFKTNGTTRMTVKYSNGYVGINNTNPSYHMDVEGYVRATNVQVSSDERYKEDIKDYESNLDNIKKLKPVTYKFKRRDWTDLMEAEATGISEEPLLPADSLTALTDSSSIVAEFIPIDEPPVDEFAVKMEEDMFNRNRIGFIAQDLQQVFPELVYEDRDGYLSIDYISLIPVLVAALKEQQEEIDALNEKLKAVLPEDEKEKKN